MMIKEFLFLWVLMGKQTENNLWEFLASYTFEKAMLRLIVGSGGQSLESCRPDVMIDSRA